MRGKKKILITGASGYLGSRLCHFLNSCGHQIIALVSSESHTSTKMSNCVSKFIIGDIRDKKTIQEIAKSQVHIIIHLVSLNHYDSEADVNNSFDVNVKPVANILSSSLKSNSHLEKFFFVSTVQVYGNSLKGDISVEQKMSPVNIYGMTHQIGEEICNYYNNNTKLNCINLRLSNSYGHPSVPNEKCWELVVNNLVKSAFENKKIVLRSDGNMQKDFIHFSEICTTIKSLINETEKGVNTFNIVSSKTRSLLRVAEQVRFAYFKTYGLEIPIYINESELHTENEKTATAAEYEFVKDFTFQFDLEKPDGIAKNVVEMFNYLETSSLDVSD